MGSVDTSFSDLVTIIVKAPNQQIADQTIQCHLNWTIKKLKDYLSEVYPSKPKLEEQKLIYSGKLLTDSAVLKDVLRTFEGQENHTVHLVCTFKSPKTNKPLISKFPFPGSDRNDMNRSNDSASNRNDSSHITNRSSSQHSSTNSSMPSAPNGYIFNQINSNQFPSMNIFDPRYFYTGTNFININNVDINQQFAMMQHAYAQYISQYMQMMGQPGYNYIPSHITQSVPRPVNSSVYPQNVLPEQNQAVNQVRDNPAAAPVVNDVDDEENRLNRDWLDWFYVFSRIVILLSVVYFYSTPLRLLAVVLLILMFYLHQNLRLQHENLNLHLNNNNNNVVNNNNQNENNNHNQENRRRLEDEVLGTENGESETNTSDDQSSTSESAENVTEQNDLESPVEPQRLSVISVTLLAIRTFFLSLVPDQPTV